MKETDSVVVFLGANGASGIVDMVVMDGMGVVIILPCINGVVYILLVVCPTKECVLIHLLIFLK